MEKEDVVYYVQHTNPLNNDMKSIGTFSTKEKAEQAILHALKQPGFDKTPEGFEICEYVLDKNKWAD